MVSTYDTSKSGSPLILTTSCSKRFCDKRCSDCCSRTAPSSHEPKDLAPCTSREPACRGLLHRVRFQADWNNRNSFRHRPANADDDLSLIRRVAPRKLQLDSRQSGLAFTLVSGKLGT